MLFCDHLTLQEVLEAKQTDREGLLARGFEALSDFAGTEQLREAKLLSESPA